MLSQRAARASLRVGVGIGPGRSRDLNRTLAAYGKEPRAASIEMLELAIADAPLVKVTVRRHTPG